MLEPLVQNETNQLLRAPAGGANQTLKVPHHVFQIAVPWGSSLPYMGLWRFPRCIQTIAGLPLDPEWLQKHKYLLLSSVHNLRSLPNQEKGAVRPSM